MREAVEREIKRRDRALDGADMKGQAQMNCAAMSGTVRNLEHGSQRQRAGVHRRHRTYDGAADHRAGPPSESIRSADIERALEKRFGWIEQKPYGGNLLNPTFSRVMGNFEDHEEVVKLVILMEDVLMKEGAIPSDHVWGVLRHRGRRSASLVLGRKRVQNLLGRYPALRAAAEPVRRVIDKARR